MPKMSAHLVLVKTDSGALRIAEKRSAHRQLAAVIGGRASQAQGAGHKWNSTTASRAARKRWAKKPMTHRGYRKGQRFRNLPRVSHIALRERYSLNPTNGIQYSPALRVWVITDTISTRIISERTALKRLGHLPRPHDRPVATQIVR